MFHRDCPLDSPLTASSLAVPSLPASSLRHHSKNVGMPPLSRPGRVQWFRRVEQTTLAKSASFACIFLAGTEKSRGIRNPESKEIWTPSGSGKESKKRCSRSESWLRNLWSLWYIYFLIDRFDEFMNIFVEKYVWIDDRVRNKKFYDNRKVDMNCSKRGIRWESEEIMKRK